MLRVPRFILARSLVRRFAVSAPALPLGEPKTWDTAGVEKFASSLGLEDEDVKILTANKINGKRLLSLTEDKLLRVGMPLGPASDLAASIAELRNTHETVTLMLKCGGNGKRGVFVPHTFASSEHFAKFASDNHIYVSTKDGLKRHAVMTLSEAQKLEDGDFLMLFAPFDVLEERLGLVDDHIKNSSDGQEHATTLAIVRCASMRKAFGDLHVVNDGYPVEFYVKGGKQVLEAGGLVINSVVLLRNEAKHTPTSADASLQQSRARLLESILSNPSAFRSEPAHILPELERAGVKTVRPVLSGYKFASSVEKTCVEEGVLIMKTREAHVKEPIQHLRLHGIGVKV